MKTKVDFQNFDLIRDGLGGRPTTQRYLLVAR